MGGLASRPEKKEEYPEDVQVRRRTRRQRLERRRLGLELMGRGLSKRKRMMIRNVEEEDFPLTDDEEDSGKAKEGFFKVFHEEVMKVEKMEVIINHNNTEEIETDTSGIVSSSSSSETKEPSSTAGNFDKVEAEDGTNENVDNKSYSSGPSIVSTPVKYPDIVEIEYDDDEEDNQWNRHESFCSSGSGNDDLWSNAATACSSSSNEELLENFEEYFRVKDKMKKKERHVPGNDNGGGGHSRVNFGKEYVIVSSSSDDEEDIIKNNMECPTQPTHPTWIEVDDDDDYIDDNEVIPETPVKDKKQDLIESNPEVYDSDLMSLLDSGYPLDLVDFEGKVVMKNEDVLFPALQVVEDIEGDDNIIPHVEDGKAFLPIFKFHGGAYLYHVEESDLHQEDMNIS